MKLVREVCFYTTNFINKLVIYIIILEIDNPEFHDEETIASVWSPLPPLLPTLSVM